MVAEASLLRKRKFLRGGGRHFVRKELCSFSEQVFAVAERAGAALSVERSLVGV